MEAEANGENMYNTFIARKPRWRSQENHDVHLVVSEMINDCSNRWALDCPSWTFDFPKRLPDAASRLHPALWGSILQEVLGTCRALVLPLPCVSSVNICCCPRLAPPVALPFPWGSCWFDATRLMWFLKEVSLPHHNYVIPIFLLLGIESCCSCWFMNLRVGRKKLDWSQSGRSKQMEGGDWDLANPRPSGRRSIKLNISLDGLPPCSTYSWQSTLLGGHSPPIWNGRGKRNRRGCLEERRVVR